MTDKAQLKALVAEDEPAMLSLNAGFLRQKGFQVTEASDGEKAWDLAEVQAFDLVLLDVMMPGMSGWEVCKRVKHSANGANTAVVMLTGIGETLNDMTSSLFAADAWLNKPYDFAELERKLREALAKFGKDMPDGGSAYYTTDEEPPPSMPYDAGPSLRKTSGKPAAKPAAKKPAAKKPAAKKPAAKKPAAKKPAAKASKPGAKKTAKPAAKKPAAKKPAAKKPAAKKTAKPAAKKPAAKKPAAKKPAKPAAKKPAAKKPAAKKPAPKKPAAKRK